MAGPFVDPFPFEPFGQGNGSHDFSSNQQQQQQQYDLFSHLTVNHGQLPPFPGDVAGGATDSPPLTSPHAPFHRPLGMPGVDIDMDTMDMDLLLSLPTSLPTTTTSTAPTTAPLTHHHQPATWPDHPPADSPPWQNHQQPQLHQQQNQQQNHPSPETQDLAPKLALALRDRDAALVALSALQNQVYAARQLEKRLRAERDDARSQAAFLRKERTAGRATEARLRRERNQARVQVAILRGGYKDGGGKGRSMSSGVAGGLEAVLGGFRGKVKGGGGGGGGDGGGEGGGVGEVVLQGERMEELLREVSPGLLHSPLEGGFTSLSE